MSEHPVKPITRADLDFTIASNCAIAVCLTLWRFADYPFWRAALAGVGYALGLWLVRWITR